MNGHRLILNDGTEYENGHAGLGNGILWLWFPGMAFWTVSDLVRDAERMSKIIFRYGEEQEVYEGYTACTGIMADGNEIAVRIVKG